MSKLRERTRDLHADLENRLRLGAPDAGRLQYADHVAAMWGWLQPLEDRLWQRCNWRAEVAPLERSGKTGWLHADILVAREDGFLQHVPDVCRDHPDFSDPASRYGWAYVIEGSMLGGSVLQRRLSARLSPWPMHYLQGYGMHAGHRWRDFLDSLARDVSSAEQIETACEGAAQAFASVGDWLRQQGAA